MAFGNIQAQDLDPSLDLAKETTLNGVKSAVDEINTSMADVAKESTVAEVKPVLVEFNNKVGTSEDAESQPTLFGKLAQLGQLVPEKLAEVVTKITGLDTKIGTSDDVAGTATLFGQMKASSNGNTKGIAFVPSDNLKINFLNENIDIAKGQYMFLGYICFNCSGYVKFVTHIKGKNTELSGAMLDMLSSKKGDALRSGDTYPTKGDTTTSSNPPTIFDDVAQVAKNNTTSFKDITTYCYVTPGVYGIGLNGYYNGAVCDSIKVYFDVKEDELCGFKV